MTDTEPDHFAGATVLLPVQTRMAPPMVALEMPHGWTTDEHKSERPQAIAAFYVDEGDQVTEYRVFAWDVESLGPDRKPGTAGLVTADGQTVCTEQGRPLVFENTDSAMAYAINLCGWHAAAAMLLTNTMTTKTLER